jgi:uncharacterized protein
MNDMHTGVLDTLAAESRRRQNMNGCHGYEHTERVIELCRRLGEAMGADMEVLMPAAILHDIAREEPDHAEKGAGEASKLLEKARYSLEKIPLICDAIRVHSFSYGKKASTLEAMILSDADKLDAMGAIGVYRTAMYSGELMRPQEDFVAHFHEKLLTLKDMLYTEEARRLAEGRHRYMQAYLEEFMRELRAEA